LIVKNTEEHKKMYENHVKDSKKQLAELANTQRVELNKDYDLMIKNHKIELDTSMVNLENKFINKIKLELGELMNKKTGLLVQLDKKKDEYNLELIESKSKMVSELKVSGESILKETENLRKSVVELNTAVGGKMEQFEKDLQEKLKGINDKNWDVNERLKEIDNSQFENYWKVIEPKIKKQTEVIIQSTLEQSLIRISPILEQLIDRMLAEKINGAKNNKK